MTGCYHGRMNDVLFVCTGNIFRSVVAEYLLRHYVEGKAPWVVRSAGIEVSSQPIHPLLIDIMAEHGLDISDHKPTKLTRDLLAKTAIVIAMGQNHQQHVAAEYARDVPLFNEVCLQRSEPVLDVSEAIPKWQTAEPWRVEAHVRGVVEHIIRHTPLLYQNIKTRLENSE